MSIFESISDSLTIFDLIAPLLFIGFGILFLYLYLAPYIKLNYGKKYTPVGAKVLKSYIHEFHRTSSGRTSLLYKPVVEYEYEIDGEKYISQKLFLTTRSYSSSIKYHAEEFQKKYTEGSVITAYVHPKNPEKSYLEPIMKYNFILLFMGTFLMIIGFIIYLIKY